MGLAENQDQAGYNYAGSYGGGSDSNRSFMSGSDAPPGTVTPQGGGGGGTTPDTSYEDALAAERARLERIRTMNAKAIMESQMKSFGLGALANKIFGWITQGYEPDAIMALVRQTKEYADRFPAMKALQTKGQSISESEYIAYEQSMTSYSKMFGLPNGMLDGKDMVTKLLTNGVSAREVEERATKASASMYSLPKEFRDTMQQYYGIDSGGLTGYFLDPDTAAPLLEKQYVAAQIGMEGAGQGIGVAAAMAERLYAAGVDRADARKGFGEVQSERSFTEGKGETTDIGTLVDANLMNNTDAKKKVERIGRSRVNQFEGGGSFAGGKSGTQGIGSASA